MLMPMPETNPRHLRLEYLAATLRRKLSCANGSAPCATEACDDTLGRLFVDDADSLRARLITIDHALTRLNVGLGDQCERCGRPIDAARLGQAPQLTRCRDCD